MERFLGCSYRVFLSSVFVECSFQAFLWSAFVQRSYGFFRRAFLIAWSYGSRVPMDRFHRGFLSRVLIEGS